MTKARQEATIEKAPLVVIGAGPGGYAAAFRAVELGLAVTLVDPEANPGGVCLHRGCIPSKAFLHAAKLVRDAAEAKAMGLHFAAPRLDIDALRGWKDGIVETLTGGLGGKVKQKQIRYLRGRARLSGPRELAVDLTEGKTAALAFDQAILATGSRPALPAFGADLSGASSTAPAPCTRRRFPAPCSSSAAATSASNSARSTPHWAAASPWSRCCLS